jgi:transcriptional regulator with XRE-family HTH domain
MKNIGERLKNAIKKSNYTQKELAEILNTSQNTLSSYTKGKAAITVEMLKNICDVIQVPIEWIIYGKEENQLNQSEIDTINRYKKLNINNKIKADGYIEGLFKEQEMLSTSESTETEEEKNVNTG